MRREVEALLRSVEEVQAASRRQCTLEPEDDVVMPMSAWDKLMQAYRGAVGLRGEKGDPMGDKTAGLIGKYRVERVDGKPVTPCFVLEEKDPLARGAVLAYADAAEQAGYHALAADLRAWMARAALKDGPSGIAGETP